MNTSSVLVPNVQYVCGPTGSNDGAQIFDRKLLAALAGRGVYVSPHHPGRQRALHLPLWQGRLIGQDAITAKLRKAQREGARIVLSHESFFGIAHRIPVDLLIVHNYMPCFSFPGRRSLEVYYHLGSQTFMKRAFANARAIVFLSHRDHSRALKKFPQIANRSHVLPPPPHRTELGHRRDDVIHISGSEDWLPKRLSRLTPDERALIAAASFRIEDFGARPSPAFGLITDRFTVGFKLKLMQMLYVGDAIASLSEIRDEIKALVPGYPWWQEVASVDEAVEWFTALRRDPAWQAHSAEHVREGLPDWAETAIEVERILDLDVQSNALETNSV